MSINKLNEEEQYSWDQNRCGLKVGDSVKVIRTAKNYEKGWPNGWPKDMNERIGLESEITKISPSGIELNSMFSYPFFVLEYIPGFKSDKVLKCPMCGKDMCVMDKRQDEIHISDKPDVFERAITFEYECSDPECGMSMYYPFKVSEVPDGESYFE